MFNRAIKLCFISFVVLTFSSCAGFYGGSQRGVSSSLVDYLYPDGKTPSKHEQSTPHLQIPLTVGLAFVPTKFSSHQTLPEAKKNELLEQVKQKFVGLDYVKEIVIVPETYMRSSKGFNGVGQLARLYGLDVVALVSYDQVSVTSERRRSFLYWTIVGAYIIKGNKSNTTTFVDTAVFDVNSNKLLLRAPGVSELEKSSTLIELGKTNRDLRHEGFELAMTDMSNNLATELELFRARIKEDKSVQVSSRNGGGGGTPWQVLLFLVSLVIIRTVKRQNSELGKD